MKTVFLTAISLLIPLQACNLLYEDPKYSNGVCITPTDPNYTWYGEYAQVVGYAKVDGYSGKNYILYFPTGGSKDTIFTKSIEQQTKTVNKENCQ